jgi:hypothetical protein
MKDKKRIKIKSQKRRIFKNHMKNKNHGRRQESSSEVLRNKRIEKRYKRNYVQDIVRQKFRTLKLKNKIELFKRSVEEGYSTQLILFRERN